jgi:hypothetical protein
VQQEPWWRFRCRDVRRRTDTTDQRWRWCDRKLGGSRDRHQGGGRESALGRFTGCRMHGVISRVLVMRAMPVDGNGMRMDRDHADMTQDTE